MLPTREWSSRVGRALGRARWSIVSVGLTYAVSVAVGIAMVHMNNPLAIEQREQLVHIVVQTDQAAIAHLSGEDVQAWLGDFVGNATIGALPKAVSGLAVILAYPQVAYQGWIGGIVSKASNGPSRFGDYRGTVYYVVTIVLQLTGYSMVVGAGVNAGVALLRPKVEYQGKRWMGILPVEAAKDFGWIYLAALPIFFVASMWEFLSPWNLWG